MDCRAAGCQGCPEEAHALDWKVEVNLLPYEQPNFSGHPDTWHDGGGGGFEVLKAECQALGLSVGGPFFLDLLDDEAEAKLEALCEEVRESQEDDFDDHPEDFEEDW